MLYLMFNEGYAVSTGAQVARGDLAMEAIRLTRMLRASLPDDPEVAGLLALMLLNDARRPARTGPAGELVPLAEQDRTLWDPALIAEGVALISAALPRGAVGEYQLQAAIAALHDEAASDGGDRLAADPRAVRAARAHDEQPDGHAEPCRRGRDGRRTGRRPEDPR